MSPWTYIRAILGPGLHWTRSVQELQDAIIAENGKTRVDAEGDVARGLEVI